MGLDFYDIELKCSFHSHSNWIQLSLSLSFVRCHSPYCQNWLTMNKSSFWKTWNKSFPPNLLKLFIWFHIHNMACNTEWYWILMTLHRIVCVPFTFIQWNVNKIIPCSWQLHHSSEKNRSSEYFSISIVLMKDMHITFFFQLHNHWRKKQTNEQRISF